MDAQQRRLPTHRPPSHPGEVLKTLFMDPAAVTITRLAQHLGCTRPALSEIVNGRRGISPEMALKLADAFNTTPDIWMTLQADYDLFKARQTHQPVSPYSETA